ncbi:hypothetical protein Rsub_02103 [Raphidocelis subcapitata]|uniref:sucrose-phosphate phosphatase n=1 Tax=Raphidocelis subcapitata TaxID=307507 RepID=A0A2V0NNT0_9CHLO|nr:hypothetical protein Rsub_02103 [Raphidocelis subcapitata]|eukprot:GBF89226.1 hypothetical protein Rsub_02103 [Raphidocelis subcapitata]
MASDVSAVLRARPPPRFVLVSDLDHTMVQNEDPAHARLLAFNALWASSFAPDPLLVFSTGRSPALFAQLWDEAPLLAPDVLICSVGTELFYRTPSGAYEPDGSWEAVLDAGWDRDAAAAVAARLPQLKPQVSSEQRRHKLSYHLSATGREAASLLEGLRADLAAAGVGAKVVYSGGVDVDILAAGAGKGRALEFLLGQLRQLGRWPEGGVQVNGDSGNDAELFLVPGVRGCVVANAHAELLQFYEAHKGAGGGGGGAGGNRPEAAAAAGSPGGGGGGEPGPRMLLASQPCAGGIVEALHAFGSVAEAEAAAAAAAEGAEGEGEVGAPGAAAAAAAARRAVVRHIAPALAAGGDAAAALSASAAPRAEWIAADGRRVALRAGGKRAAGRHAPEGRGGGGGGAVAWVDALSIAPAGAPGLALARFEAWSFGGGGGEGEGGRRAGDGARAVCALLRVGGGGGGGGFELLSVQETPIAAAHTSAAAILALSRGGGGGVDGVDGEGGGV